METGELEQALLETVRIRRLHRALELAARYPVAALGERRVAIGFGASLVLEPQSIGGQSIRSIGFEQELDVLVEQAVTLLLAQALLTACLEQ